MAGSCVRVDPPLIDFRDVTAGEVYRRTLTVTNVGKSIKRIIIEKPAGELFSFIPSSHAVMVPSGLSVGGLLEFTPDSEEEVRDCIRVHVDGVETMQIPVLGSPRVCTLRTDSLIDFGCVVASSQVIRKLHPVTNQGSESGVFQVELCGADSSLSLSPSSGVVAAGSTQWLKVELLTDRPRDINHEALLKLQNHPAVVLRIRAQVVEQQLQLADLQGTPLSCLWFGPVYCGTTRVETVVLRNSAPRACDWFCLLQDGAAGTEEGTDLQRSTGAALLEGMKRCSPAGPDASQVLVCEPSQGRLGPHDRTMVSVCFRPVSRRKDPDSSSSRQDYSLFLLFDTVDNKHGFTHINANSSVELAVKGSGLPVSLVPAPSHRFDFLSCETGQSSDLLCVLHNLCSQLPVSFRFCKSAHFSSKPSAATIGPGQSQDVVLTFRARQQGSFSVRQKIEVLGCVASQKDATKLQVSCFHTITLVLSASCHNVTTNPRPRLVPGEVCRSQRKVKSTDTDTHLREKTESAQEEELLSVPDEGACSITPSSITTIFPSMPFHHVDADDATEEEEEQRRRHRQIYQDFIRQTRLEQINQRLLETLEDVDIGTVLAQGLVPPGLHSRDLKTTRYSETKPYFLNSSSSSQVSEGVKAVPSSSQQVADCSRTLTAVELNQVLISPLFLDFGSVCVQSVCVETLQITNRLPTSVWVQLEAECPELQGSSPLSHVLPPFSHSSLPLKFESSQLGRFSRSLSYSVNQQHPGQILVQAQVVPLVLELSTELLVLKARPTSLAASGHRSSVTLRNPRSRAAEFTWRAADGEREDLVSVRPASGSVEPHMELDCEVVWCPSVPCPSEGHLELCVHEGNTQHLTWVVQVGTSSVQLEEKRLRFSSVPLNRTSIRTAVLHNTGPNHAYYQVLDVCPVPGMMVSPCEGVVPSRGHADLNVHFNPERVFRFNSRIEIALKNMKSVELGVCGSVEPPDVDISVSHFQFSGVYTGSQQAVLFTLTNQSSAAARVAFDLSKYEDFSIRILQSCSQAEPGLSVVELQTGQTQECCLVFSPTQVLSYDFHLPLTVNGVNWISASSSPPPFPSSAPGSPLPAGSSRSHITMATQQPLCVQATAMCGPLELSPWSLQFNVDPQSEPCSQDVELKAECEECVCWRPATGECVFWWFDCSLPTGGSGQQELCSVTPSSGHLRPGQSICLKVTVSPKRGTTAVKEARLSLPLYLELNRETGAQKANQQPYRELSVTITLREPSVTCDSHQVLLTPVPLERSIETTLSLQAAGYLSETTISAEVDEVDMDDGTKLQPVSVWFPHGNRIQPQNQNQEESRVTSLLCNVSFCSAVPLSLRTTITFTDQLSNKFKVELFAAADNCLLTAWPYMALHRHDQRIVLQTGATAVEALLQLHHTPASELTSPSSSSFDHSSSVYEDSDSSSSSNSGTEQSTRASPIRDTPTGLGIPEFPAASTEAGQYYQAVLVAVERWFSFFGWPSGPRPISIPHTLRRVDLRTAESKGPTSGSSLNRDTRSVEEMLHHVAGRRVPGMRFCQTFSRDINQRTNQLIQEHEAMLAFLKVKGACLCHIRPAYLLDVSEFKHWCSLQPSNSEPGLDFSKLDYESLSKRSWTDVLLQTYKVLVLSRVSQRSLTTPLNHEVTDRIPLDGSQLLVSNIYSSYELQLMSWLNLNYQTMRKTVWEADRVPSARWIVNFDLDLTDGLVLAAVIAAYCPYLIRSHFSRMYTSVNSAEQILHNNIIVAQALTRLGLNMDVQSTDLFESNPVQMLVLCVHLYEELPHYVPLHTVTLSGDLYGTFSKQIRVRNPTLKPFKYQAFLLGDDARFFSFPDGPFVTIPPKSSSALRVQFSSFFLQPMEAVVQLRSSCGRRHSTLAFSLKAHVGHMTPMNSVQCDSPCYRLTKIQVPLVNRFNREATFRVVLVESNFNPLEPEAGKDGLVQHQVCPSSSKKKTSSDLVGGGTEDGSHVLSDDEFLCPVRTVHLKPNQSDSLTILYLPFSSGTRFCSVLLVSPQVGDMVYLVKATSHLPLPSSVSVKTSCSSASITENSDAGVCVSVLRLHCKVGEVCEEVLQVPQVNQRWENALAAWAQFCMSSGERRRRTLTHTLDSSTVRTTTATHKLIRQQSCLAQLMRSVYQIKGIQYNVEVSSPQYFNLPSTVCIPVMDDTHRPSENPADHGSVGIPLRFQADSAGQFTCQVVLRSCSDTRVYLLEALVTSQRESTHLDLSSPIYRSVIQHIPLVNETQQDWKLQAVVFGEAFSGPDEFNVPAGTRESYPLTFHPTTQCCVTGELTLRREHDGTESVFTLRGVGERPLLVEHVVLPCSVGKTTTTQLDVPNHTKRRLSLKGELTLRREHDGTESVFTLRGVGERPLLVEHVVLPCSVGKTTTTQLDVPIHTKRRLSLNQCWD